MDPSEQMLNKEAFHNIYHRFAEVKVGPLHFRAQPPWTKVHLKDKVSSGHKNRYSKLCIARPAALCLPTHSANLKGDSEDHSY